MVADAVAVGVEVAEGVAVGIGVEEGVGVGLGEETLWLVVPLLKADKVSDW